jgi:addiction module HigA family antidote
MPMFDPSHPGDIIRETIEGLSEEHGRKYTVEEIAIGLGTTRKTLSALINCKQSVSPEMAIRLAAAFQNTTPEFWLRLQENYDLAQARRRVSTDHVRVFWKPRPQSAQLTM